MRLVFTIILCAAAFGAMADDRTIFGFELGKPFPTLPQCRYTILPYTSVKSYESPVLETCIQTDDHPEVVNGQTVRSNIVSFSKQEHPLVIGGALVLTEAGGNLIGIHFGTRGVDDQSFVMQELQKKYGKPKSVENLHVQNKFGATYESINAQWHAGDVSVTFLGTIGSLDHGLVYVELPAATEIRNLEDQSLRSSGRHM